MQTNIAVVFTRLDPAHVVMRRIGLTTCTLFAVQLGRADAVYGCCCQLPMGLSDSPVDTKISIRPGRKVGRNSDRPIAGRKVGSGTDAGRTDGPLINVRSATSIVSSHDKALDFLVIRSSQVCHCIQ